MNFEEGADQGLKGHDGQHHQEPGNLGLGGDDQNLFLPGTFGTHSSESCQEPAQPVLPVGDNHLGRILSGNWV